MHGTFHRIKRDNNHNCGTSIAFGGDRDSGIGKTDCFLVKFWMPFVWKEKYAIVSLRRQTLWLSTHLRIMRSSLHLIYYEASPSWMESMPCIPVGTLPCEDVLLFWLDSRERWATLNAATTSSRSKYWCMCYASCLFIRDWMRRVQLDFSCLSRWEWERIAITEYNSSVHRAKLITRLYYIPTTPSSSISYIRIIRWVLTILFPVQNGFTIHVNLCSTHDGRGENRVIIKRQESLV